MLHHVYPFEPLKLKREIHKCEHPKHFFLEKKAKTADSSQKKREKAFECDFCSSKFKEKGSLRQHTFYLFMKKIAPMTVQFV